MKTFKLRGSAGGKLATDPKGKSNYEKYLDVKQEIERLRELQKTVKDPNGKMALERQFKITQLLNQLSDLREVKDKIELSDTSKSYIKEWLITELYGIPKDIKSRYLDKGNICEDEAIDKAVEWLDLPFALKNETSFEDDFFTGTPDLITNGVVYDIKNSWDCHTFPLFESEIPTKDYFYQLQIYMHLTGARKAVLCYLLLNTPEALTWETPHDYSAMDKKYRINTFEVEYDAEVIATLQGRVLAAREYISELLKQIEA